MQQTVEIPMGKIQTYGTTSGYIYLHIPAYLCRQFGIRPATFFSVVYRDDRLVLEQVKKDADSREENET